MRTIRSSRACRASVRSSVSTSGGFSTRGFCRGRYNECVFGKSSGMLMSTSFVAVAADNDDDDDDRSREFSPVPVPVCDLDGGPNPSEDFGVLLQGVSGDGAVNV